MENQVYTSEANRILNVIEKFSKSNYFKYHCISDTRNSERYLFYGITYSYASMRFNKYDKLIGFYIYIEDLPIKDKLTNLIHEFGHVLDFYYNRNLFSFEENRNKLAEEVREWIYGIKLLSDMNLLDRTSFYRSIMSYVYDLSYNIPRSEERKYNDFIDCILFNGNINNFKPEMF